jgi:hypothetical protein
MSLWLHAMHERHYFSYTRRVGSENRHVVVEGLAQVLTALAVSTKATERRAFRSSRNEQLVM